MAKEVIDPARLGIARTNRMFSVFYTVVILKSISSGRKSYKDILEVFDQSGVSGKTEEWLSTRIIQLEQALYLTRIYKTVGDIRSKSPEIFLTEAGEAALNRWEGEWTKMVTAMLIAGNGIRVEVK